MSLDKLDLPKDSDFGYGQIFSVLARRSAWIIGALTISSLLAAHNSLQKEPTYVSSMQLLIEPNQPELVGDVRADAAGRRLVQETPVEIDYATQIRVLQGSELLEKVVVLLKKDYPDLTVDDIRGGLAVVRATTAETTSAADETETSILQIDYVSHDPQETQQVLNALQNVYLTYNLEQQELRLQNGLAFINKQLPVAQQEVSRAEQSLEQFRKTHNLIDPELRASDLAKTQVSVEQERQQIQAEYNEFKARYEELKAQLNRSPEGARISTRLSESIRYQNLLNSYQETELALAQQRVQFREDSAYVRRLKDQLENQKRLLGQEVEHVLGSASIPESQLFEAGQLGETDLTVVRELGQVEATLSGLAARDQGLARTEQLIQSELALYPTLIAQFNRLQPEIEIKRETLQQLLRAQQEASINIARGGLNWQVIESAQPGSKTGPDLMADILLGSVAGLALGIMLAFAREAMDKKLRTAAQIRQQTLIPVLGNVPRLTSASSGPALPADLSGLSAYPHPALQSLNWPPFRESLGLIGKNLQLLSSEKSIRSLAMTSALPGEGKSTIAIGLAIAAARLNQRVLLLDGNLRKPGLHQKLNLPGDQGLTTFLAGQTSQPVIHRVKLFDCEIEVLVAGSASLDPTRLLSSPAMQALMADFEQTYDLVIVDSTAVIGTVDALQAVSLCRGTLLVTRLNRASQEDLNQALSLLYRADVVGIVANDDRSYQTRNFIDIEPAQALYPREDLAKSVT